MTFQNNQTVAAQVDFHPVLDTQQEEGWRDALDLAVEAIDEPAIWAIMASQRHNEEAQAHLTNRVSRLEYLSGGMPVYCDMFMLPVIAPAGCDVINTRDVWQSVRPHLLQEIEGWFRKDVAVTVFEGILPVDWITTWRPRIIRQHLNRIATGIKSQKVEFVTSEIALPDDAPRLGFVPIGCTSIKGWPTLPEVNTLRDRRLKDALSFGLQIAAPAGPHEMAPAPMVLTPERLQYAITEGISSWLVRLNEAVGIQGWVVMPSERISDVVKITLQLNSETVPYTQFTLRLHQIGMQGFKDIVSVLKTAAPSLDKPVDMTAEQYLSHLETVS